ncbi:MAG: roadblock/LC7 domain-containing protein [Gammaproteobacteria bacterium]|nr:roadblock/LC7 domain-containing protein [Gammaproteobacteria bacterium]MCW9003898.1 roadblock/LC7 domain-containing protein [Gammaproteobacteria bacterium]MCW9056247.1 roadblock/LC7 domain-containing protein [Gammaproteobacteria bacterium]
MNKQYKLTYNGLVFAIASSDYVSQRLQLFKLLAHFGHAAATVDQISSCLGVSVDSAGQFVENLINSGFIQLDESPESIDQKNIDAPNEFEMLLEALSINGKAILADAHGLIIAASGYSKSDSDYIAAIATNLVAISEQAKSRTKNPVDKHLWNTGLSWGAFRALCVSVHIGTRQYILVVGGLPNLEGDEFLDAVGFLVRRYGCG